MLEKDTLSVQTIIKCLNTNYGISVAALTHLSIGADTNASIYKAQTSNQLVYFIKVKLGHHYGIGVEIVELLQQARVQQIIPPIKTIHGKSILSIDDFSLIVYPFVEGQNGFNMNLTNDKWIKLGKTLKQIHEFKVPESIQKQIRKETFSTKWQEIVESIYPHIEANFLDDEIAIKLSMFMKKKLPDIYRLVNRAKLLGKKLKSTSLQFVLCHSDIHGGNVLLDKNSCIYIVDWDEPILAPKERDLMFIGGGVGNVWNEPIEEQFFYRGYGKTEIDTVALTYYRYERIVEDIATYCQELLLKTTGGKDRLKMYKHFIAMFEPQGVVDIAFRTDESL